MTNGTADTMSNLSSQQMHGVTLFLLGIAALILSAGVAWAFSRVTRTRLVVHPWVITFMSFALFVAGVVLCWFGVSSVVEGR
jgi:hypothetical protein